MPPGRRHGPGQIIVKNPQNAGKTIKRLLSYLAGKYKWLFVIVLICILLSSIAGVAGSLFMQILIDDYITPLLGEEDPVFTGLLHAILIMAGIYGIGVISTLFYSRFMVTVSQGILKQIRDEMFSSMQKLPIRYFDAHPFGDTMSHYTNDTDTLREMMGYSVPQMFASMITIVAAVAAMLYTSLHLSFLVLVSVICMLYVTKQIGGKSATYFAKQQKSLGQVNGYIEEMIHGQRVVKVFCHEDKVKQEFDVQNDELCDHATEANLFANIFMPIIMNMANLQYVAVAIVGGVLAVNGIGELTLGAIAAFLQLSRTFSMPVAQISQQINSVVTALAGAERIFALMDEEPELDDGCVTLVHAQYLDGVLQESETYTGILAWKQPQKDGSVMYTKLAGNIQFSDVDFGYEPEKMVLHDISLYAHPGEKIAFVGATGAGKTTITNLINRFYDIPSGTILYDGTPIEHIRKKDLRRSLGVVLQDTSLFSDTVMENIRYGRLDATDEEVYSAARLAYADDFISKLPDGYQTMLEGDGETLSQGQRQLLSIARVAVANPPVMVLDEATSSIDTRTEVIVQQGMDSLMHGRTVFVIAHRLSTVLNSNIIMVLEAGHIIERGTHEKLLQEMGTYYQLYTGAFELE
jgi:ATP-binding cassette subfamily B protein